MEIKKKQILEILPSFNFIFLSEEEFNHIPIENDLIKGVNANYKYYLDLKNKISPKSGVNFFDMCHLLGYYAKSGAELNLVGKAVEYLYKTCTEEEIDLFLTNINNVSFNNKYANLLIEAIITGDFKENSIFYAKIFNHFKLFSKQIEKINKNRIRAINIRGASHPLDEERMKKIKETGKAIICDDVNDYINKVKVISKYPFLKEYRNILILETYDADELEEIAKFYLYAVETVKDDELYFENLKQKFGTKHINWLESTNPINLVLGYILKVCSTFTGTGSKIMIDGILNPQNKHVAIFDDENNLEAKATVIYHDDYIFCGDLNFTDIILNTLTKEEEREYYYMYFSSLKAQYDSLIKRGFDIKNIRIATDEGTFINCIRGKKDAKEFKDMLTKCSFYWEEYDEKLFDHKPPEYKIKRGLI